MSELSLEKRIKVFSVNPYSIAMVIPKAYAELLGIDGDSEVDVGLDIENEQIIIKKVSEKK